MLTATETAKLKRTNQWLLTATGRGLRRVPRVRDMLV